MKNRIVLLEQTYKVCIDEINFDPKLIDGDVLIKITNSGICGSDLHYFRNGGLGTFRQQMPLSLGHEPAGVVIESKSKIIKKYDRVGIEPGHSCGSCFYCEEKKNNLCPDVKFLGANADGALRDYIIVNERQLIKIPDNISFMHAALIEPFGVALHNVNLANIDNKKIDNIAIVGGGTIGLLIYKIIKFYYPELKVDIIENNYKRSVIIKENLNIITKPFVDKNEKNYQVVFETGATQNSLSLAMDIIAPSGDIVFISIPETDYVEINPHKMRLNEAKIVFSRRSAVEFDLLMTKFYEVKPYDIEIITNIFKPEEAQKAFELADIKNCLKVQLNFES